MRWILLSLMALIGACWGEDEEQPGELVGSFQALGLMVEQSCGTAVPAPDPLDLKFDLRSESNGRAYWRLWGGSMFAGIENNGTYTFQTSQSYMVVEPDRFRGYVGCSVTQRDVFTFEVSVPEIEAGMDAGVEDAGIDGDADAGVDVEVDPALVLITGSQTTEIVPLAGADCTPAVAALGGPFLSLPCRVEYVLNGNGIAPE
ncbi:MAG: hypothetical protein HKN10_02475 [Myxococcales bacterium]|nr:hypothetical protein [Deltaproteobacteria bacterium]NNE17320.1 hypothetical protein [Myxococcales bacterium]